MTLAKKWRHSLPKLRNGVGIASVGGILVSGVLTLVIMPILYDLCTKKNGNNTTLPNRNYE